MPFQLFAHPVPSEMSCIYPAVVAAIGHKIEQYQSSEIKD
jgi:hypothetical protein